MGLIDMKKTTIDCFEREVEGRVSLVEKKLTSDGGRRADRSWVMICLFVSRSRKLRRGDAEVMSMMLKLMRGM